jgi:hypothetical protein
MSTVALLAERQRTHGDFAVMARTAEELDDILSRGVARPLSRAQRHALRMILVKIARIVSGDPNHADHWRDIAGYAELTAGSCPTPTPEPEK